MDDGLVHEKADPFPRRMPVIIRAAVELPRSVRSFDERSLSKLGDHFLPARPISITSFKFHAPNRSKAGWTNTVQAKTFW
jgi:hypothetical protein